MNQKRNRITRIVTTWLALALLVIASTAILTGCAEDSNAPDGYEYATCSGEYFRLFIPTGWQVNTESGVSGAYITANTHVTMQEVYFDPSAVTETVTTTEEDPTTTDETDTADTESVADTAASASDGDAETDPMARLSAELRAFALYHESKVSRMTNYTSQKAMVGTIGDAPAYPAWDITYEAKVGEIAYRFRQLLTTVGGRYYVFTYSSTADEAFDLWLDQIDDVIAEIVFETYPYEGEHERDIPEDAQTPEGMQRVSTAEVIYRFYAPADWVVDKDNGHCMVYVSETDRSNVSVMSYMPGDAGITVEDYWKACLSEYQNTAAFEDFLLIGEDKEQKLGGAAAMVCEFSYTMGGVDYRCRQVLSGYRGMVYVMTYTATADLYETHLDEAVAMQDALTFQ